MDSFDLLGNEDAQYLREKFRGGVPDVAEDLRRQIVAMGAELSELPRPIAKAKIFAYLADNIEVSVSKHDFFPAFANWNRDKLPLAPVRSMWNREVDAEISQTAAAIAAGNAAGKFRIWKDFDHSVPDWDAALALGFPGLLKRAESFSDGSPFFRGIIITYEAILRLLRRIAAVAREVPECRREADAVEALARREPQSFYEALMFEYLYFIFSEHFDVMQARSLGGIDRLLGHFWDGSDDSRKILDYFLLQWQSINNYWGHPACLGGTKADGTTEVCDFSCAVLDSLDRLQISTPKFHIKLDDATPRTFLRKALSMIRDHNASLVFVCDKGTLNALRRFGFTAEDARNADISGCYEILLRGRETHTFSTHLNLLYPLTTLLEGSAPETFEEFLAEYKRRVAEIIEEMIEVINVIEKYPAKINPSNVYSATIEHALRVGRDAFADGSEINSTALLITGSASAADSLCAVRKFVYKKQLLTLADFRAILAADWEGHEDLREAILNDEEKFGNGNARADAIAKDLVEFCASRINGRPNSRRSFYKASLHNAKQYFELGKITGATPDGRRAGDEMSKNNSPVMGMDRHGATALIRSALTIDNSLFLGDCPLDVMMLPASVQGEGGLDALETLLQVYRKGGGLAIQFNFLSPEVLIDAQAHPEKYEGLQVRVCGWNARFNDMVKREQDAFIARALNAAE